VSMVFYNWFAGRSQWELGARRHLIRDCECVCVVTLRVRDEDRSELESRQEQAIRRRRDWGLELRVEIVKDNRNLRFR